MARMIKKGDRFKVDYTTGGGEQIDEGEWIVKTKTPKTFIVKKVSEGGIFDTYEKGDEIKIGAKHHNPVKNWGDGTFTVYPNRSGIPYYFEPIPKESRRDTQIWRH